MTEVQETTERKTHTVQKIKGKRSSTECRCDDGVPEVGEFEITNLKGTHCVKCMHVLTWERVNGQPLKVLAGGMKLTSPPPEPKNKQPGPTIPTPAPAPSAPVETIDSFFVFEVSRAEKPDQMFFHMETPNGKSFKVLVPSKIEKVERVMNEKGLIVCKRVQVEFKGYDSYGVPILPKVLAMAK